MIRAASRIQRSFQLAAPVEAAWALLADVPRWGVLFPHVASVEPFRPPGHPPNGDRQRGDAFVWRMAPLGPPGARVETVYACRYTAEPARHALAWAPIEGVGNAQFAGACVLEDGGDVTAGTLRLDATLEIPAPSFVRAVVEPAVAAEMGRMTDTFIGRLAAALRR